MIVSYIKENLESINKIVLSVPKTDVSKLSYRKIILKGEIYFQEESIKKNQAFHKNLKIDEIEKSLTINLDKFSIVNILEEEKQVTFKKTKDGKIIKSVNKQRNKVSITHNEIKHYLINEGEKLDVLVDIGVFTKEYKVVKSMYDKFIQINKFIEVVDSKIKDFKGNKITVVDFGCGKSYLTFILYYYLTKKLNLNAEIYGYDLKEDVVKNCNDIALKYQYYGLHFEVKDVTKDRLFNGEIDMIVSLHACDIATDFALNYAIENKVKYIFSVPCCQHEINSQIKSAGDFSFILNYGALKDKFSTILTDSIRVKVLESVGYEVDVVEFVTLDNIPKNLMIRATLKKNKNIEKLKEIENLQRMCGFKQTLFEMVKEKYETSK